MLAPDHAVADEIEWSLEVFRRGRGRDGFDFGRVGGESGVSCELVFGFGLPGHFRESWSGAIIVKIDGTGGRRYFPTKWQT